MVWEQPQVSSVDLAFKFPRSPTNWAYVGSAGQIVWSMKAPPYLPLTSLCQIPQYAFKGLGSSIENNPDELGLFWQNKGGLLRPDHNRLL